MTARLLIVGPPGSGKGTQSTNIAARFGIPAVSTGDIFRENVKQGTPLGLEAKAFMDKGEYVPDEVTNRMVRDRLNQADAAHGFLLDGYPRTVNQVEVLDALLAEQGHSLDAVIELTADVDEVVARLLARAQEQGRADDTEEVIRHRMNVYAEQTAPLLNLFSERGLLRKVDGLGSIDDVGDRIANALSDLDGSHV
ncbi:adenylate kinase [Micrococcales bacterium 31B]|nr:adenylate kinase [Micrococcales bacterium 31B]